MSKQLTKRNNKIVAAYKAGIKPSDIAKSFKVTKQRIQQILKVNGIIPKNDKREAFNILERNVLTDLKNGMSMFDVFVKHKVSQYDRLQLNKRGFKLDLKKERKIILDKRNKEYLKLYKKGHTALEILSFLNLDKHVDYIYKNVKSANDGKLPKRINTYTKRSMELSKEIKKIGRKHTLRDTQKILTKRGYTNAFGQPLKVGTIIKRFYE